MKHSIKNTIRGMAKHIGIKVKFVDYLSDDVHGKLLPREKRILINARKPRTEHIFTLLHELGHFLVHVNKMHVLRNPRFLEIHWKSAGLAKFFSKVRRGVRFFRNRHCGKEWEADLWAICAFVYLAKHLGFRDELRSFRIRHPEKTNLFRLATIGAVCGEVKRRLQQISQLLSLPFKVSR